VSHEVVATCCWECERGTDAPRSVTLRADHRDVGTLWLCPSCYQSSYLPLAGDEPEVLDVEAGKVGCRRR
jgi:hypothetical protein